MIKIIFPLKAKEIFNLMFYLICQDNPEPKNSKTG